MGDIHAASREKFLDSLICEQIKAGQLLPPELSDIVQQHDDSFNMSNESVAESLLDADVVDTQAGASYHPKTFYNLLREIISSFEDVISWMPDGKSIVVKDDFALKTRVFPKYFPSLHNFRSFDQKLKRNGFLRIYRKGNSQYMLKTYGLTEFRVYENSHFLEDPFESEY